MKVGIVGAGAVGTACMFAMALRGSARDLAEDEAGALDESAATLRRALKSVNSE